METPKRRKSKDNPYTLKYNQNINAYSVTFINSYGKLCNINIDISLYNAFNSFELDDLSELNEFDRHIEHTNIMDNDEVLYRKTLYKSELTDDLAEKNILKSEIAHAINQLPDIQKCRLKKYYFDNKTYEEIAREENCTKRAVKFSVDIALQKISKKLNK